MYMGPMKAIDVPNCGSGRGWPTGTWGKPHQRWAKKMTTITRSYERRWGIQDVTCSKGRRRRNKREKKEREKKKKKKSRIQ